MKRGNKTYEIMYRIFFLEFQEKSFSFKIYLEFRKSCFFFYNTFSFTSLKTMQNRYFKVNKQEPVCLVTTEMT